MNPVAKFTERDIDGSINICLWIACLPSTCGGTPYKTTLHLTSEEVTKTDVTLCGQALTKHPYGELGSVGRGNFLCWVYADSAFGPISPGCGCDGTAVDEIVTVLKERVRARGDTAQIQRAEQTLERLAEVDTKLNLIMEHLNIPQPQSMDERGRVEG